MFENMTLEEPDSNKKDANGKQITKFVLSPEQRQIKIDGKPITELDPKDNRLFYDNNRTGLNAKFLYMFP